MEDVVIVGGGVAGLSCLNALLDGGVWALLIEGATIGTPKMCGEFLAPLAVDGLEKWDISPIQSIQKAVFSTSKNQIKINFSNPAGAISRSEVERQLAERALKKGGRIRENSLIQKITPPENGSPYLLLLSSGEIVQAKTVFFATGKYSQQVPASFPYYGIKLHFPHVLAHDTLHMYSVKDAYFGVVPISNELSNFACLAKREVVEKFGSGKEFFNSLCKHNQALNYLMQNTDMEKMIWFEGQAPEFQMKKIPNWPHAFWIGDAVTSLHPAIGSGFAHSVSSAKLAAEGYLQNNAKVCVLTSMQLAKQQFWLGKIIHRLLLKPILGFFAIYFIKINSWLVRFFLKRLRYES